MQKSSVPSRSLGIETVKMPSKNSSRTAGMRC